jgi:AraC family transcriptional regulator, ethanolamine operon transcriptional activator
MADGPTGSTQTSISTEPSRGPRTATLFGPGYAPAGWHSDQDPDRARQAPDGETQAFRKLSTNSLEELAQAVPGAKVSISSAAAPSFEGRIFYVDLDGVRLNMAEVSQPIVTVAGDRVATSTACIVANRACSVNGDGLRAEEMAVVRSGEPYTLRTAGAARVHSFALQPTLFAAFPELELPFGPSAVQGGGRWTSGTEGARQRFAKLNRSIFAALDARPETLKCAEARISLRSSMLDAIAGIGDLGSYRVDRGAVRRHSTIMLRLERAIAEVDYRPVDIGDLCRATGSSRRSLEAVIRQRTGRSLHDYMRSLRLCRARELLCHPTRETSVTDVAFRLGFWHLSRFANAYVSAFGELPSVTLRKVLGERLTEGAPVPASYVPNSHATQAQPDC